MLKSSTNLIENRNISNKNNQSLNTLFGSLNNLSQFIQKKSKLPQKYYKNCVFLAQNQVQNQKKIYQWRLKTQFPIVKILNFQLFERKQQNCNKQFQIDVYVSNQLKRINQFENILFNQALYLLKQSLIGFQRLYHRFGFLQILPSMIIINKNNKCEVWINEDLHSNKKIDNQKKIYIDKTESKMIHTLTNIICGITQNITNSCAFFDKFCQFKTFIQAIMFIERYSQEQKIKIPQSLITFKNQSNKFSTQLSMLKCSQNFKESSKNQKQKITFSSKIPSFIKKLKKKNSDESQEPFIFKRTQTNKSQKLDIDRSMTNISRNLSSNSLIKQPLLFRKNSMLNRKKSNQQTFNSQKFWQKMKIQQKQKNEDTNLLSIQIPKKFINNFSSFSGQNSPMYPSSPISPLYSLSTSPYKEGQQQLSFQEDEKYSNYSFNNKKNFKNFQSAQNMFLTVVQNRKHQCNLSKISNNTTNKNTKKPFMKLNQMKEDLQSLSNGSEKHENGEIFSSVDKQKYISQISCCKSKKELSQIQNSPKRYRKISQDLVICSDKKQKRIPSFLNVKKYQSQEQIILNLKSNTLDNQQQQKSILRQTIMSKNGWKNLALFCQNRMNESIIQGNEVESKSQFTTLQLLKLGSMGKQLVSSMIGDENQDFQDMDYKYKIKIRNEREKQIQKLFL